MAVTDGGLEAFVHVPCATYRLPGHNPQMGKEKHDCHRRMAAELFNRVWELLDQSERTPEDDQEMLAAAYGSRYHWRVVGGPKQHCVSDWQLSRVWVVLGDARQATVHGELSLELAQKHHLGPFYVGYAHEALARAAALAGDEEASRRHLGEAEELSLDISKSDDAELLRADLNNLRS